MKKTMFIEDKLFYKFFNYMYRSLKMNLYLTLLNVVLFLLCTFTFINNGTVLLFSLAFLFMGPGVMSMVKQLSKDDGEASFREYVGYFKTFFLKGTFLSVLLLASMIWFYVLIHFFLNNMSLIILLPLFLTFGVVSLSTVIFTMFASVADSESSVIAILKSNFLLSWKKLFISYFVVVVIAVLFFVMYYRSVYGFLILMSMTLDYLYKIYSRFIVGN